MTAASARLVVERADDERTHRRRGSVRRRVEEAEREPEGDAREAQHPAELPAAEHRDRRRFGIHRERVRDDHGDRREFVALAAVLVMVASGRVPDVVATVPVAVLVVAVGLVSPGTVVDVLDRIGPTLAFGAIFVVAEIAELAGLFTHAGTLARCADVDPARRRGVDRGPR